MMNFTSESARAEWFRLCPRGTPRAAQALCGGADEVDVHLGRTPGTVVLSSKEGSGCSSLLGFDGISVSFGSFLPDPGKRALAWNRHLAGACSMGAIWASGAEEDDEVAQLIGFERGQIRYGDHLAPEVTFSDEALCASLAWKRLERCLDAFLRASLVGPAWMTPTPAVEEIAGRVAENAGLESTPLASGLPLSGLDLLSCSASFSGDRVRVPDPRFLKNLSVSFGLHGGPAGASWASRAAARFRAASPWPPSPDGKLWLPPGEQRTDRDEMPQIPEERFDEFLSFCKSHGVHSDRLPMPCGLLKSGQKAIDPEKAVKMSRLADLKELLTRTLVSEDGTLLDGHHRWAALVIKGDPAAMMDCVKLHAPFADCLRLARQFLGDATFAASTPEQLKVVAKKLRKQIWLDGYGSLYWHPERQEVYYVIADSTETEEWKMAQKILEDVTGVEKVTIQSETPPGDDKGFEKLFPEDAPRKTGRYLKRSELLAADGKTSANFGLGMSPPGQYVPDGYDWRSGPGSEEDYGDGDEMARMIRMLKRRFKKSFGEDQRAAARDLLTSLSRDEAIDVYRGLIKGGKDPADAEEAGWKLYRVLGRLDTYDGPDSPASFRHLLSEWKPGVLRARALAGSARETLLARKSFGVAWKALDVALKGVLGYHGRLDGTLDPTKKVYFEAAVQGYKDSARAARDARDLVKKRGAVGREELARSLEPLARPEWKVTGNAVSLPAFTLALRWVQSLVARKGGETGEITIDARVEPKSRRSEFLTPGTLLVCPLDGPRACCHLLGHVLERQLAGARSLCHALLRFRTQGEVPSDMGLTPGGMALSGELGRLGVFDASFRGTDAWYCGKRNPDHHHVGSEILAMGLEACYEDAHSFAAGDPEYFLTVIGVLTGDLRGEWPPREEAIE